MFVTIDVQYACDFPHLPTEADFEQWVTTALSVEQNYHSQEVELTLRIVGEEEGQQLNQMWRQGKAATNVLSFPFDYPPGFEPDVLLLGDIIICAPVVKREAETQNKLMQAHWAHLVVHGLLHLLGYDHVTEVQAQAMEQLEVNILEQLGYADPYESRVLEPEDIIQ